METSPEPEEPVNLSQDASSSEQPFHITGNETWSLKTPDGQIYGPVSKPELDEWVEQGRVSATCLVRAEGTMHWQASIVLYPQLVGRRGPQDGAMAAAQRRAAMAQAGGQRGTAVQQPNKGVLVLVLGIAGIMFIPFPVFALIAFFLGRSETQAMARGQASTQGRWMVDIGYGLGIVGSVLGGLFYFGCCCFGGIF